LHFHESPRQTLVTLFGYHVMTLHGFVFVQVAPTSSKQHGVNVGVNASAAPFQQASGYGSHGYSTGEALNDTEAVCLQVSCKSYSIHLHTNKSVLLLTMSPLISPQCGLHILFELCSLYKHKHDACVNTLVICWKVSACSSKRILAC